MDYFHFLLALLSFVCVSCEKPDWTEDELTRSIEEPSDSTATGTLHISITATEWGGVEEYSY